MSDETPTLDAPETTMHDDTEPAETTEPVEREPRRIELELPDELGVYEHQRHRGGDETFLFLSSFGGGYQALAYDIDSDGEILETEIVGHAEREDRAVGMCEYWLQANPGGVLGATENPTAGSGGGNIFDKLSGMFGGGQ